MPKLNVPKVCSGQKSNKQQSINTKNNKYQINNIYVLCYDLALTITKNIQKFWLSVTNITNLLGHINHDQVILLAT